MSEGQGALVLEIFKRNNWLSMSVFEQERVASTLKHYSQCPLPEEEVGNISREMSAILEKTGRNGRLDPEAVRSFKKGAQFLWDQLLTRQAKERLRSAQEQGLTFSIDEELIDIPWELLHDGKEFLSLRFNTGRVVKTAQPPLSPQYREAPGRMKVLILANPTNDLDSAYQEGLYIKNQLDKRRREVNVDFKSTSIDSVYVKKNLRDYDIVHFAGHCEHDPDDQRGGGWVLEDGKFTTQDILSLGEALPFPSIIFSNACHSAQSSPANYSLASAFLFSGVRHYIGTTRKVEDAQSIIFAREFYAPLINGKSVGESLRLARLALRRERGEDDFGWAPYLLYGDPNFALFKSREKPLVKKPKPAAVFNRRRILKAALFLIFIAAASVLLFNLPTRNPSALAMYLKARGLSLKGDNQAAAELALKALDNDPFFLAAYPLLGESSMRAGKRREALKYYFDYLLFSEKKQDKKGQANACIGLGWIYHLQGDYPKAFDFYQKAALLSRENKDWANQAIALRKLAVWYTDKEEYAQALELLMKSSEINRGLSSNPAGRYNLACDYFDIGLVFVNKGDLSTAREFYAKSARIFEKLKLKGELSDYYFNLGEICLFEKRYQKALEYYLQGIKIDQGQGNLPSLASDYNMLGELYLEMDNLDKAEESFQRAVELSGKIEAPLESAQGNYNLGMLYAKKGRKNKARECLRRAQEVYAKVDAPDYQRIKKELLELGY